MGVRLLASRALRTHRRAWASLFVALTMVSALLGGMALAIGSTALGHASVDRYAAVPVVVTGDQSTQYTTKPWGDPPTTATAPLTERVGVPVATVALLRSVPGVRAVIADDVFAVPGVGADDRPVVGRPWPAAALAPYGLRAGRAPERPGEVVAGAGLGLRTGQEVTTAADGDYRVVGIADGPAALYFTQVRAQQLAGHPASVDVIGVLPAPGVSDGQLYTAVRHALDVAHAQDMSAGERAPGDSSSLRVLTGDGRGNAQYLATAPVQVELLAMLATVSGLVLVIALLVLSSLVAQALQQRSGELALLRAVGMTPRQLRASVGREVVRIATWAGLTGAAAAVPSFLGLWHLLRATGALPDGLELPTPPWLFTGVVVTAALTVGAARSVVPFACARRPTAHSAEPGTARRITGLVLLFCGVSAAGTATLQSSDTAAAAAGTAAVTMVAACAVLGPWIARGALLVLGGPMRRLGGPPGRLAAAACSSDSRRLGAAITPIVLVIAFTAVQFSAGVTMTHAGAAQARQAMRAEFSVSGTGVTAQRALTVPGVAAATDILPGTVILPHTSAGSPLLDRLPVLGVTPGGLDGTLDPGVTHGSITALGQPGTVAVGEDRAASLGVRVGSTVTLRFDDGQQQRLRVVAVYDRALALGDFMLARDQLARHMSAQPTGQVLVATAPGADPTGVRRALQALGRGPGTLVQSPPAPIQLAVEGAQLNSTMSTVLMAAIAALTVVAVYSTLALITIGRCPELALLRRLGAGRRQLRRMLRVEAAAVTVIGLAVGAAVAAFPLLAFTLTVAHSLPYLPLPVLGVMLAVPVVTGFAGVLAPARRVLRRRTG
jgi:putative ABC transport system permease protein